MLLIAGFVGRSEHGKVNEPTLVERWGQFLVKFGGFRKSQYLAHAVNGFFEEGGRKCYVLNVREKSDEAFSEALSIIESRKLNIDMLAFPGYFSEKFHSEVAKFCKEKDIIAILDLPENIEDIPKKKEEEEKSSEEEEEEPKPWERDKWERKRRLKIADRIEIPVKEEHCLYFYPWIYVWDFYRGESYVPPSGNVAGVYALYGEKQRKRKPDVDNITITARALKYPFSEEEKEILKAKGVHCLNIRVKV